MSEAAPVCATCTSAAGACRRLSGCCEHSGASNPPAGLLQCSSMRRRAASRWATCRKGAGRGAVAQLRAGGMAVACHEINRATGQGGTLRCARSRESAARGAHLPAQHGQAAGLQQHDAAPDVGVLDHHLRGRPARVGGSSLTQGGAASCRQEHAAWEGLRVKALRPMGGAARGAACEEARAGRCPCKAEAAAARQAASLGAASGIVGGALCVLAAHLGPCWREQLQAGDGLILHGSECLHAICEVQLQAPALPALRVPAGPGGRARGEQGGAQRGRPRSQGAGVLQCMAAWPPGAPSHLCFVPAAMFTTSSSCRK